jgi:hypothetical protein
MNLPNYSEKACTPEFKVVEETLVGSLFLFPDYFFAG